MTRRGEALAGALIMAAILGVLYFAMTLGDARRCAWLTQHKDQHPIGFSTYCTADGPR